MKNFPEDTFSLTKLDPKNPNILIYMDYDYNDLKLEFIKGNILYTEFLLISFLRRNNENR